jgi:hypothetical protein
LVALQSANLYTSERLVATIAPTIAGVVAVTVTAAEVIATPAATPTVATTPTAAAITTATATIPAASTTATATTILAGASFIHGQLTVIERVAIEALNGFLCGFFGHHLDEPETLRTIRFAILDDCHILNIPSLREQITELALCRSIRQIPDIQFLAHNMLLWNGPTHTEAYRRGNNQKGPDVAKQSDPNLDT